MTTKELRGHEGEWVEFRSVGGARAMGRLEGIEPPRYPGDKSTVRLKRWRADGPFIAIVAPRDCLLFKEPSKKLLAIVEVIESMEANA